MELTHESWFELEDGAGKVLLLLSITGTVGADTVSDLQTFDASPRYYTDIAQKYVRTTRVNLPHFFSSRRYPSRAAIGQSNRNFAQTSADVQDKF